MAKFSPDSEAKDSSSYDAQENPQPSPQDIQQLPDDDNVIFPSVGEFIFGKGFSEVVVESQESVDNEGNNTALKSVGEALKRAVLSIDQRISELEANSYEYKGKLNALDRMTLWSQSHRDMPPSSLQTIELGPIEQRVNSAKLKIEEEISKIKKHVADLRSRQIEYNEQFTQIVRPAAHIDAKNIDQLSEEVTPSTFLGRLGSVWDYTKTGATLIVSGGLLATGLVATAGVAALGAAPIIWIGPTSLTFVGGASLTALEVVFAGVCGVVAQAGAVGTAIISLVGVGGVATIGYLTTDKLATLITKSEEVREHKKLKVSEKEQRILKKNIAEADEALKALEEKMDEVNISVTIDFDNVVEEAYAANGDAHLSTYHSLYSTSTNVCIKALKDLRNELRDNDQISNADIRTKYEKPLFDVLKAWAYSEKGVIGRDYPVMNGRNGIYAAYQTMCTSANPDVARRQFVEFCAELKGAGDGLKWTHNRGAEKMAAIALLGIMDDNKSPAEILDSINQASDEYLAVCVKQVALDIPREYVLLNLDGEKVIVNDAILLTKEAFGELSNGQRGFAQFMCDQGKALGLFYDIGTAVLKNKAKSGNQALAPEGIKVACIVKDGDSVYAVLTSLYRRSFDKDGNPIETYNQQDPNHGGIIKASVIYDISKFGDEEFRHGFGLEIPIRLIVECTGADMLDLEIPPTLIRTTTEPDKFLVSKALGDRGLLDTWKRYVDKQDSSNPSAAVPEEYLGEVDKCKAELVLRGLPHPLTFSSAASESGIEECSKVPEFHLAPEDEGHAALLLGTTDGEQV